MIKSKIVKATGAAMLLALSIGVMAGCGDDDTTTTAATNPAVTTGRVNNNAAGETVKESETNGSEIEFTGASLDDESYETME